MLKPIRGVIQVCSYCGEQVKGKAAFCLDCSTKPKREEMLNQNCDILGQLREKGYCKDKVLLPKP